MMILVTYDVNMTTESGARRLRRVAKQCLRFGVRVQCSVFECRINGTQFTELRHALEQEIDHEQDSIRFYCIDEHAQKKMTALGVSHGIDPTSTIIL